MTTVSNTTIAFAAFAVGVVGQLVTSVTSVTAGLTPASAQAVPMSAKPVSVGLAPASARQTTPPSATERPSDGRAIETAQESTRAAATADDTVTEQSKKPKQPTSAVEAPDTVTDSTISAQGEVRRATTGTKGADGVTVTDRDDAAQANTGGDEARAKPDAVPDDKGDTDDAPQKGTAPQKDSLTNEKP